MISNQEEEISTSIKNNKLKRNSLKASKENDKENDNKSINIGILDKLRIIKEENNSSHLLVKNNIALIKSSNDLEIEELINKIIGINTQNNNNNNINIGLRKTIKLISNEIKTNFLSLYDYNYTIINKYTYLKKEILKNCGIYVIICNIFENNLEFFFTDFIDILRNNKDCSKKPIVFLLINSTSNFLMSMVSSEQLAIVKEQISVLFNKFKYKFINVDINEVNIDKLLLDILN